MHQEADARGELIARAAQRGHQVEAERYFAEREERPIFPATIHTCSCGGLLGPGAAHNAVTCWLSPGRAAAPPACPAETTTVHTALRGLVDTLAGRTWDARDPVVALLVEARIALDEATAAETASGGER